MTTTNSSTLPELSAEQLSLLPNRDDLKARFRLGKDTRERGLRHVAEIKRQLAERQHTRELAQAHHLPPRHREAA